jgi:pyruvate/2-oxoglutarate dehydrogenase complex dihydrolipoamide dehydrogenase (E3) component
MAEALPRDAVVGVIGAGAMGAGIAQVAAQAGHRVLLADAQPGAVERALQRMAKELRALAAKGKISAADAEATMRRSMTSAAAGSSSRRSSRTWTSSAACSAASMPSSMSDASWQPTRRRCR